MWVVKVSENNKSIGVINIHKTEAVFICGHLVAKNKCKGWGSKNISFSLTQKVMYFDTIPIITFFPAAKIAEIFLKQ